MIKGFFFDLDGTLVDTYRADFQAYRDAIIEVTGATIDEREFNKYHGREMSIKLKLLIPGIKEDVVAEIRKAKKRHYHKYVSTTTPNNSLITFIESFVQYSVVALVTTAKRDNALKVLSEHGLEGHFSHTVFGDDVANPKPHPEPYLRALEMTGLQPGEVIVFEDTDSGIQSAEAAGLAVVHVKEFAS